MSIRRSTCVGVVAVVALSLLAGCGASNSADTAAAAPAPAAPADSSSGTSSSTVTDADVDSGLTQLQTITQTISNDLTADQYTQAQDEYAMIAPIWGRIGNGVRGRDSSEWTTFDQQFDSLRDAIAKKDANSAKAAYNTFQSGASDYRSKYPANSPNVPGRTQPNAPGPQHDNGGPGNATTPTTPIAPTAPVTQPSAAATPAAVSNPAPASTVDHSSGTTSDHDSGTTSDHRTGTDPQRRP